MRINDSLSIATYLQEIFQRYANFKKEKIETMDTIINYTLAYPVMYAIPVWIKAQKILELGIGSNALSTYIFYEALKITGGKLISVDIDPSLNYEKFPEFDKNIWTCMNCNDMILDFSQSEFDIIMIDTDHELNHTIQEMERFVPSLKSGGFLYMHDTDQDQVRRAVDYFISTHTDLELFYREPVKAKPEITIFKKL